MGLPWVRLDTQFPSNPKVLGLIEDKNYRAALGYVAGLCYSGAHGTDGFLPNLSLPFVHATRRDAALLTDAGLWIPTAGGWDINGWNEFQPSTEETANRRAAAQKAALARWDKKRRAEGDA